MVAQAVRKRAMNDCSEPLDRHAIAYNLIQWPYGIKFLIFQI
jgi:hypothetical protein